MKCLQSRLCLELCDIIRVPSDG